MPCDPDLAERVRELLAAEPGPTERRMFGGLAFPLDVYARTPGGQRGQRG